MCHIMASNITITCHTKHVDLRCTYVNEYVEDGVVKIIFGKSASNILTKNLSAELYEKHSRKMDGEKPHHVTSFKNI